MRPTIVRKALKRGAEFATPRTNRLGSALLGGYLSRGCLNFLYERGGPGVGVVVTRFMSEAKPREPFLWRSRFAGQDLRVPVLPALPRSWSNALFWRWPAALPLRVVYEWYLLNTEAGVLLDAGANDGMHTYPFAACGWRSIAFEPQPSCVEYLRYTCQTNGFSEVDVVPGVLDEQQAASVPFFVSESSWFSSLSREQVEKFEPAETSQTRAWTIDDYCEENDDLAPTCLKIDVEGAELRVLRGAHHTLDRARPDIFAEVLTTEENKREVWEMLQALDYRVFLITTDRGSPLRPILDLPAFLTAGEGHDHIDVVAFAGPTLARRLDDHFDLS